MAEISYSVARTTEGDKLVSWATVTESDAFQAFPNDENYSHAVIATAGTIGGATIVLEGSLDGTNYYGLNDINGSAISFAADGLSSILEKPRYLKPSHSGGTGESETVTILFRR